MPDLIHRDGLKQTLLDLGFYPAIVKSALEKAPTIDAVEVVRCKDCKYGDWDSEPHDAMVCMRTKDGFWRSGNDFCSYGLRRSNAEQRTNCYGLLALHCADAPDN